LRAFKIQEKPSASQREHTALPNMNFFTFYLLLWLILAFLDLDPDPESKFNPDGDPKY
jgi:hypothetical protein